MNMISHDFYCMKCGNRGIPLSRKRGHCHGKHHRKKLYCPTCRLEINHIEIRNYDELIEFKENFAKGEYKDEAESSLNYIRNSGIGQKYMVK